MPFCRRFTLKYLVHTSTMHSFFTPALISLLALAAQARDVPANVQSFYNSIKSQGTCSNKLATGFYSTDGGVSSKFHPTPKTREYATKHRP